MNRPNLSCFLARVMRNRCCYRSKRETGDGVQRPLLRVAALAAGLLAGLPGALQAQTDLTAQVEAGQNIVLTGGQYVVKIPALGVGSTISALSANVYAHSDLTCYACGHYAAANEPTIVYRGTISGTGVLTVTNTNSTVNPAHVAGGAPTPFTGGMLLFTNPQTFTSGGAAPSLVIDGNTEVAFDQGIGGDLGGSFAPSTTDPRNVTNNGYLYSYNANPLNAWGSLLDAQVDAGVVTFEGGNVMSNGSQYRGVVFDMSGAHLQAHGVFSDPATPIVQSNGFTMETLGPNYLMQGTPLTYKSVYGGDVYSFGAGTQVAGQGVQVFTGQAVPVTGSSMKDLLSASEARVFDYIGSLAGGKGEAFDIEATLQMGDGQAIVDNGDGTNNTFLQANIEGTGNALTIGLSEKIPVTVADALLNQAMGFDYSGTYTYDAGVNMQYTSAGVTPLRSSYGNLVVMNPDPGNTGKKPNYLILTSPMFMDGITEIDQNAVLQIGDGTQGNRTSKTVTVNGQSYTGMYSTSYGDGMILTHENTLSARAQNPKVFASVPLVDQIIINGQLVVDNVPDASDVTLADPVISSIILTNELDTITGTGGIKQVGTLPLTLMENTTYTGQTEVGAGSTLFLALSTAGVPPTIATSSGVYLSGAGGTFDISKGGSQVIQDLIGVSGTTVNLGGSNLLMGTGNSTSFLGVITGTGGFAKQGGGTLTMGGASTATGLTALLGGSIQLGVAGVGGAALGGAATVNPGTTLSVEGAGEKIGGAVTNGGTLQMNAGSALTVGGSFTATPASSMQVEVTPSGAPEIGSQGAVAVSGTLTVQLDAGTYSSNTYRLLSGSSLTGTFKNVVFTGANILPATAVVSYTANAVLLTITAPVQPLLTLTANPTTGPVGTNVTFQVTAAGPAPGDAVPTGTVTLQDAGGASVTLTLDSTGHAVFSTTALPVGTNVVTATYSGDKNDFPAVSASVTVTITAAAVQGSTLTLSASPLTGPVGTNVTFQVTVTGAGAGSSVPTGAVTLQDSAGASVTLTLDSTGHGVFSTTALAAGTHVVTASYSGDKNYGASVSSGVTVTIENSGTGAGGTGGGVGDFTLSSDTSVLTMKFGGALNAKLLVAPVNGFAQAVGLSCPGLPTTLQCSFAPATVTTKGAPVGSVLTITSTPTVPYKVAGVALPSSDALRAGLGGVGFVLSVPILMLLGVYRRRTVMRRLLAVVLFVSCAGAFGLLSGCGCGIFGTAATTVVTVQGVSGSLQHSVTVSVTTTQ